MNGVTQSQGARARVTLANTTRGVIARPLRGVIYGPEGVGKSSWAADAPSPYFIGAEDGTAQLNVERVEPADWENIFSLVTELASAEHPYRTLVLDTLDWAEPLCWEHVSRAGGKSSIEDFDYGKGYTAAVNEWRRLLYALDRLRDARGMGIILVAHSKTATFRNPEGDDFDRYTMKLHEKSAGVIKEWCDALLFATYETYTHESKKRVRGISTGARLIKTVRHAAYDAKNRYNLPEEMPLDWAEFSDGVLANAQSFAKLTESIKSMLPTMADVDRKKAEEAIKRAGDDAVKLAKLADWCRGKLVIEGTKETEQ